MIFRSGTALIALETDRYNGLEVSERKCFNCRNVVEDEIHVLLHCPLYTELRNELFSIAEQILNGFQSLNNSIKVSFILSDPSIIKISAKTCYLKQKTQSVVKLM